MKWLKLPLLLVMLCLIASLGRAQSPQTPPLRRALAVATSDSSRVLLLADLSASYRYSRFDSVEFYAERGLALARRIRFLKGEGRCLSRLGILDAERGDLPEALRKDLAALRLNEKSHDREGTARTLNQLGLLYEALEDYRPALRYYLRAKTLYEQPGVGDDSQMVSVLANLGSTYDGRRQFDSAAYFLDRAWEITKHSHTIKHSCWGNPTPYLLREQGRLEAARGHNSLAIEYYWRGALAAVPENDQRSRCRAYLYMAELYRQQGRIESAICYAEKSLVVGRPLPYTVGIVRASSLLTAAYESQHERDSTLKYMQIMLNAQNSMYDPQRIKQLDAIGFAEQQRLRELEDEQVRREARDRVYGLLGGLAALLLLAAGLVYNNYQQQRANRRLQALNGQVTQQSEEMLIQRNRLAAMLQELKNAQNQVILHQKMASLGELMAGVAHELRGPVQTMRDFSRISMGLCQELEVEIRKGIFAVEDEGMTQAILTSLCRYQEQLNYQSRQAHGVVQNMLNHASAAPTHRQLTDINQLVEDCLHMTYHDFKEKNDTLEVDLDLALDPVAGNALMLRHEVSRALQNIYTTALQAVQQRQAHQELHYQPRLRVRTRRRDDKVEIVVRDNGFGLSRVELKSLFQRAFSTEPERASLGLALSYDIVGSHGGTLEADTVVGEFTEFRLVLPASAPVAVAG